MRCRPLVIFMYFASFYAREEKRILVNLLISRILEEINVDQLYIASRSLGAELGKGSLLLISLLMFL